MKNYYVVYILYKEKLERGENQRTATELSTINIVNIRLLEYSNDFQG